MAWNSSNWHSSNWNASYWIAGSLSSSGSGTFIIVGTSRATSAITYNPQIANIIIPSTVLVSASVNAPTLSIGAVVLVDTISVSAYVIRPRISTSDEALDPQFTGTSIIGEPSIRKAILINNNNTTAIILAGQIGVKPGDILLYLGNGQWKIK